MRLRWWKAGFLLVALLGAALIVMMITLEGELGALPLALLSLGVVGYIYCVVRAAPPPPS